MILRRLGNKQGIADKILQYFPKHSIYIEPFFGAGGIFFNKPKADFNIMNDIDSDVFNLFTVISTNKDEFEQLFRITPIHQELLNYWKTTTETDPIRKAVRFVCLSNNLNQYLKMKKQKIIEDTLQVIDINKDKKVFDKGKKDKILITLTKF